MIINFTYRFKTEEEFLQYLGNGWRNRIQCGWDRRDMDNLIGKKLQITNIEILQKLKKGLTTYYKHNTCNRSWTIHKNMLIIKYLKPSYKPKKIERTI